MSCHTRFPALDASNILFASFSDWFILLFVSAVIGQSNKFGFSANSLSPNISMHILLTVLHIFLMLLVGRI